METPDDLDDITELAGSTAPRDTTVDPVKVWVPDQDIKEQEHVLDDLADELTEIVVWSPDRDVDDLDDEVTEVVVWSPNQDLDDLDDEVTDIVAKEADLDDLEDEVTTVMNSAAPDELGFEPTTVLKRRAPSRKVDIPATSLRDRVPEVRAPWTPPGRPRSPEFEVQAQPHRRSISTWLGAVIVALLILLALIWLVWPSGGEISVDEADTPELNSAEIEADDDN